MALKLRMSSSLSIVLVVFAVTLFSETEKAQAKWTEGTIIDEGGDWIFLTRFCFLSKVGKMYYELDYPQDFAYENLLFYFDDPGQWHAVYKRGLNCTQKEAVLNGNNKFAMDTFFCGSSLLGGRPWYKCNGTMNFSSSRERWWYVTISRCGPPSNPQVKGLYLKYKLHMTNGDDLLHQEFSADEFYILLIDIIFFILYIKIMILSILCAYKLKRRQLLHSTYKLYLAAVTLWTIHLFCMVIAWGSYGNTGWEMRRMEVLGRIIAAASNIVFILMLILLAKGYTIVRGRLTNKAMVKITSFIFVYFVVSVGLFIWEGTFFDPGLVLYYYESPPGYCMVAIILVGWLWFTKAAVFTLKHFKAKTNFYIAFYAIYSVWFWASPVIILVAMFSMAKWTREKTVNGVQQFVAYLGHVTFLILTMPSKVNTNFPYHIKTTQIGAASDDGALTGDDSSRTDEDGSSRGRQTPGAYTLSSGAYFSGTGPNLEFFITTKADARQAGAGDAPMYGPLDLNNFRIQEESPPPGYAQAIADIEHQDTTAAAQTTDLSKPGNSPELQATPEADNYNSTTNNSIINNSSNNNNNINNNNNNTDTSSEAYHYNNDNNINNNRNTDIDDPTANVRSRLPPLRGNLDSEIRRAERGGALPPINNRPVPSAPPALESEVNNSDFHVSHQLPPTYADLFSVDRNTKST